MEEVEPVLYVSVVIGGPELEITSAGVETIIGDSDDIVGPEVFETIGIVVPTLDVSVCIGIV